MSDKTPSHKTGGRFYLPENGFTVVELIIVIVVIGILAALVLINFSGIQSRARDSERKTDINSVHAQIESFFVLNDSFYPSESQITDSDWLKDNLPGSIEAILDPTGIYYTYTPTPSGCNNATLICVGYNLSADLESDGTGTGDTDSNTADYSKSSLN